MLNIEEITENISNELGNASQFRSIDRIPLGAPTLERAIEIARQYSDVLTNETSDDEYHALIEAAWRAARTSSRWVLSGQGKNEMISAFEDFVFDNRFSASGTRQSSSRKVTFVFSGMGPQWGGMGRDLAEKIPRFAAHIEKIDALFIKHNGSSVWDELLVHKDAKQLPTALAQMGNFLLQASVFNLLTDEGIIPEAILGHSAGEAAAAYAAGVYSLEEAVQVAVIRGNLQASLEGRGSMLAVGLSHTEALELIKDEPTVSIAAVNDDSAVTIAGDTDTIKKLDAQLQERKIFSKMLRVEVPYHSPVMDEITEAITSQLSFLAPKKAKTNFYSTVSGGPSDGTEWDGSYWARNVRQSVLFGETLKQTLEDGSNCFIEIAPHPVLFQSLDALSSDHSGITIHHLLSRRDSEYNTFVSSISELAINGIGRPPHRKSSPLIRMVPAPQQLWDEDPEVTDTRRGDWVNDEIPLLGQRVADVLPSFEVQVSTTDHPWIEGHSILGLGAIVPATMWAELITLALSEGGEKNVRLSDLMIVQALPVTANPTIISTRVEGSVVKCKSRPAGKASEWTLHAVATVSSVFTASADDESAETNAMPAPTGVQVEANCLYNIFNVKGLEYTGNFNNLFDITVGEDLEAWAHIDGKETFSEGRHSPWVLDAGLQLLIAAAKDWGELMYLPFRIGRVSLHHPMTEATSYQAHAKVTVRTDSELIGSVGYYDVDGKLLAELEDITCLRNLSDDVEKANFLDRNTYALRKLTLEEIAERYSPEEEEPEEGEETVEDGEITNVDVSAVEDKQAIEEILEELEEFWIAPLEASTEQAELPFDRPPIDLSTIEEESNAHLLWVVPEQELQADILATAQLIKAVGNLGIRSLTLTLIANRGQEWLLGLRRSAANSYGPSVRVILRDEQTSLAMLEAVVTLTSEHEIIFEEDEPLMHRLERVTNEELRHSDEDIDDSTGFPDTTLAFEFARGRLDKMQAVREKLRKPGPGEVTVEVESTALTWKDIGKILGTIGTAAVNTFAGHYPGFGVSGRVIEVGSGTDFAVGDLVYGPIRRPYRKHITFDAYSVSLLSKTPENVDGITAVANTLPWMAIKGIFEKAKPQPGDRMFIQSGAGGLGSVLCLYAKRLGAHVVTSVGLEDKVAEVKKISPDIEVIVARGDDIPNVLMKEGHEGFDWILSTVNGITRTTLFSLLNVRGQYVDLGKPGSVDETIPSSLFDGNKSLLLMDVDQMFARVPGWMEETVDFIAESISKPENLAAVTRYPISKMSNALVDMATGDTTGCIAITMDPDFNPPTMNSIPSMMDPDGYYLITGGYGAVGLICAQWLASRGARHIVLGGSRGKPNAESEAGINLLRAGGVEITIAKTDASDKDSVLQFVRDVKDSGGTVRGVIHAAGVISDGAFDDIDAERVAKSFGIKLEGAHYLVDAFDSLNAFQDLEFFLLTSSITSLIGLSIQSTYAGSNSGLDSIAENLRNRGVNACSMQLGPIAAGGMASDENVQRYFSAIGMTAIPPRRLFSILDLAVAANVPHFLTDEVDWAKNGRSETANGTSSMLGHFVQEAMSGANGAELEHLLSLDHKDRTEVLTITLLKIIEEAIGMEEGQLNSESNFASMGVDSLSIMEIQAGINEVLQQDLPLARMFTQDGNVGQLAGKISEYIEEKADELRESTE